MGSGLAAGGGMPPSRCVKSSRVYLSLVSPQEWGPQATGALFCSLVCL